MPLPRGIYLTPTVAYQYVRDCLGKTSATDRLKHILNVPAMYNELPLKNRGGKTYVELESIRMLLRKYDITAAPITPYLNRFQIARAKKFHSQQL